MSSNRTNARSGYVLMTVDLLLSPTALGDPIRRYADSYRSEFATVEGPSFTNERFSVYLRHTLDLPDRCCSAPAS